MNELSIKGLNDSHFHILEMLKKELNIDDVLEQWKNDGGYKLIDIGVTENDYSKSKIFSDKHNFIYHTVGIHPNNAGGVIENRFKTLEHNLNNDKKNKIVGIGETGLDYYWDTVPKDIQKDFFVSHIKLAIKYNKPVVIHNREATEDILEILNNFKGKLKGIIHCSSTSAEYVKKFVELGFYISFAGNITYKSNKIIQESLKHVPLNRLLIETDSPYLPPVPQRGRPNTPNNIKYTFFFIADILGIKDLKSILDKNINTIFSL